MKISDLKAGQGKVDVEGKIKSKDTPRTMVKFGKELNLCNAMLEDDSGEIALTLWNNDISKVKVGDKVKINNGYVNEFRGEISLTAGKFGSIEVVS